MAAKDDLWLQRMLKPLFRLLFRALARVEIEGIENVPRDAPFIIFSNHISWFDPEIVGAFIPRPIHYMAMDSLFRPKPLGFLLRKVGAFPVKRSSVDRRAIEEAMEILSRGGVVCIFPEGGIHRLAKGERLRPGIAFIAQCAGVDLVPMGLCGCRGLYRPDKWLRRAVKIVIGSGSRFAYRPRGPSPRRR